MKAPISGSLAPLACTAPPWRSRRAGSGGWLAAVCAGVLAAVAAAVLASVSVAAAGPAVQAVPSVDLDRYAGRWYEIARYPNRFQQSCAGDVEVDYARRPDGRLRVVNQCRRADGSLDRAEGVAKLADAEGPASKLKVRFAPAFLSFIPAVWGNYWIIGLDPGYRWAVVGEPGRDYLWILSRAKTLDAHDYDEAVAAAVRNGYDPAKLVPTPQH
ncbi:MAG: lipocalin family protein [Acidobacteriota bacterium]|nr:lipocalin family protein [Acidobacteriota bacterium]